jgi:uncharacterized protein (DUF1501 family)
MRRRDLFKAAAAAGVSLVAPVGLPRARAQAAPYEGRFFVMVHASGGWDPTSLCDPKGRANEEEMDPVNLYFTGDIGTAGNLRYAPLPGMRDFFEKHHRRLLVLNGVDTSTNGHDSGTRHTWSGRLSEGLPAFAALAAAGLGRDKPLAFTSFGGYDRTGGLVAPTRTGNTAVLTRIAHPDRLDPNNAEALYHSGDTLARIRRASRARATARAAVETLPVRREAVSALMLAQTGENEIARLTEHLPTLDNGNNPLFRQAQLAVAAYKAGVAVSANLVTGGFDTHGNHDATHHPRLANLLAGVDFLLEEAERQDVADKLVVVIGSDFGRTPRYNAQMGKDHWSITSMMLLGEGIRGDRVIGASDARHRPLRIDPRTLEPSETGIRLTPGHVHRQLRALAGLSGSELDRMHPIQAEDLPLFT